MTWTDERVSCARAARDGGCGVSPTTKPDLDNLLKAVGDALNQIVFVDDKQIVAASIRKEYSDRPRLEMAISPLTLPFLTGAAA